MSSKTPSAFLSRIHPFDTLPRIEIESLSSDFTNVKLKKGETIQNIGAKPTHLYFIIDGLIEESNESEIVSVYSNGEFFDSISLINNYSKHSFTALENTQCYAIPRHVFIQKLNKNKKLEQYFLQSISQKLTTLIQVQKDKDLSNIMIAKVKDAKIHKAVLIPNKTSIYEAVKIIKEEAVPTLLLKNEHSDIFIVTDSDFREKVILNRMNFDDTVDKICSGNIIYINENEFLFNAYLLMSKHGVKRVVVKDDEEKIIGVLDQISLSRFFATQTFSVSTEIDQATSLEQLKNASKSLFNITQSLHEKGVKIAFISKLINQLNRKIIDKIIQLTAPEKLLGHYCFIVMGSEGRGEQVIKTDQDNALIVSDDCQLEEKVLLHYCHELTETLVSFGFPRCEGNIMVSNSYWSRSTSDFKQLISSWVKNKTGEDFMNLAIFYDALCASGDVKLLNELKSHLFEISSNSQTFYTHFAKIIMSFDVPLGFFDGFVYAKDKDHKNEIDIKKGGIFILVQSIRSLSLEHKINRTNTLKRVIELEKIGILESEFAQEVMMAFNYLNSLKLNAQLKNIRIGKRVDNFVKPKHLNSIEKDLLKDSFKIINQLKKKCETRYRLSYI